MKLINGDAKNLLRGIQSKSIDLIITDPPYKFKSNILKGGGFFANENKRHLQVIEQKWGLKFDPVYFLKEFQRVLKIFNAYIFCNRYLLKTYIEFAENYNYNWDILILLKANPVPAFKNHYLSDKEYVMFIRDKGATFNSNNTYYDYFTYYIYSVGKNYSGHPTEKPVDFIRKMIKISSNEGDVILDPFMGSGTTGVACLYENREFIGFEIDKEYYSVAEERINKTIQLKLI